MEHRAHRSTHPQGQGWQGQDATTHHSHRQHHADTPQEGQARHRAHYRTGGTAPHRSTAHRRKNKSVHNRTSRCVIVIAWSTREQTTRSPQTTPLAPLREDMAQGIRACAVSSFVCRRGGGNAVGTTQTQNAMRGEEGAAFLPIKYKKILPFRYAKQGRRLGNGSETEN